MKEPEKSWLESGKALLKSGDYRKAVREMGRSEMTKIEQAAKEFSEEQGQVPSAFAFQSGARWAMSQIFEAAERVEQAIGLDSLLVVYFPWVGEAIRDLMRLVRGEQPKEGEEP